MASPGIVSARTPAGLLDNFYGILGGEYQELQSVWNPQRLAKRMLAVADGSANHVDHAAITFDPANLGWVMAA
jgi:hypothetical protein